MVLTRGDVDYVVTEYGVASLWGKSIKERSLSLINIAHPESRNDLLEWAKQRHYVPPEVMPFPEIEYPEELKTYVTLRDGAQVLLRPIKPSDVTMKQHLFYSLSKDTLAKRYLGSLRAMPLRRVWPYVTVDYENEMSIVGTLMEEERESIIAIGSYVRIPHTTMAEVSFVVRDDWQNLGLGTLLLNQLMEIAKKKGLRGFTAWVLTSNARMMHIFKKYGCSVKYRVEGDFYHITMEFKE